MVVLDLPSTARTHEREPSGGSEHSKGVESKTGGSSTFSFAVAELVTSFDVPFIAESLDDFRYG
jgi:hypothetical protein